MDTFKQLIEEDTTSLLSTARDAVSNKVTNAAKMLGQSFLAGLGSARGKGMLDSSRVMASLQATWKYFLTTQNAQPTMETFIDFIQTVFSVQFPEQAIYTSLYGFDPTQKTPKPPQINAPNVAVLAVQFKVIFSSKSTSQKLMAAAEQIARFAEANEMDEHYVVIMLKWLGSSYPQLLSRPGMEPLKPFLHGGKLSNNDVDKLLSALSAKYIKQLVWGAQKKIEAPSGNTDTDAGEENKQDEQVSSVGTKISIDPPSTQQDGHWGGLKIPATRTRVLTEQEILRNLNLISRGVGVIRSFDDFVKQADNDKSWMKYRDVVDHLNYKILNAMSAQLMARVQRYPVNQFVSAMVQVQRKEGVSIWSRDNMLAAYAYSRMGGNADEITAELNHFSNNSIKASLIFVTLMRFIAKEEAAHNNNNSGEATT